MGQFPNYCKPEVICEGSKGWGLGKSVEQSSFVIGNIRTWEGGVEANEEASKVTSSRRNVRFEEDQGTGLFLIYRSVLRGCSCQDLVPGV